MLSQDLALTANAAALTAPGTTGAKTFSSVSPFVGSGATLRRDQTTVASGKRYELTVSHRRTGKGWSEKIATLVKITLLRGDVDASLTGGITPEATQNFTIVRPAKSAGAITNADLKDLMGYLVHFLCTAGNPDKIINEES